jgi:hypothetical protein
MGYVDVPSPMTQDTIASEDEAKVRRNLHRRILRQVINLDDFEAAAEKILLPKYFACKTVHHLYHCRCCSQLRQSSSQEQIPRLLAVGTRSPGRRYGYVRACSYPTAISTSLQGYSATSFLHRSSSRQPAAGNSRIGREKYCGQRQPPGTTSSSGPAVMPVLPSKRWVMQELTDRSFTGRSMHPRTSRIPQSR